MGFKPVPYQNMCVHHILQIMLQKVLHIHSRTSLCCLDSFWYQSFSCWERWQLHRITIKLPLQIDPFCPCLCCFLASHRGHYPTLSVFGSYIYVHFHISHVISWSSHGDGHCRLLAGVTFSNQEFFSQIDFTRPRKTYRTIAKSLKYFCPVCLMLSGGTIE